MNVSGGSAPTPPNCRPKRSPKCRPLGLPDVAPHDRCGKILINIGKKKVFKKTFFIKNEGFVRLRKTFLIVVIFQNVFSPKAASRQPLAFGDPTNPEILEVQMFNSSNSSIVQKFNSSNSSKSRSLKIQNRKKY